MKKNHELAGIEILRFVCAFAVVVWHYQHFFFRGGYDPAVGDALRHSEPFYTPLRLFYESGSLAVPFFWAISGFIFYWHYARAIVTGTVTVSDFVIRRFSRLYPLHFVTLLIVAAGQFAYYKTHGETFIYGRNNPVWFIAQLLFASNWLTRQTETFNGPIWSVSLEILIYMLFFVIARIFGARAWVAALVAVICCVCFNLLHTFINPDVFACGMYFFAGGVAQRLSSRKGALVAASCVAGAALATLLLGHFRVSAPYLLLLATSSTIIVTRLGETMLHGLFSRLAFFGNATYSSYLIHFPLQLMIVIVVDAMGWPRALFYSPMAFLAFVAGVIGLSLVVHRYFEMPAQAFLRKHSAAYLPTGDPVRRHKQIADGR